MAIFQRQERRGARVTTRVPLPAVVDFPAPTLRALRLLDPMLDGYVLPHGEVWIVQQVPDRERIIEGRKGMLDAKVVGVPADCASVLMAEGFWLVGTLPFLEGTSAGGAVRLAQQVLNATEEQVKATMRTRRAYADSTTQRETMYKVLSDRIRSSARSDWARSWRGRLTFSHRGSYAAG